MRQLVQWLMQPRRGERPQSVADIEQRLATVVDQAASSKMVDEEATVLDKGTETVKRDEGTATMKSSEELIKSKKSEDDDTKRLFIAVTIITFLLAGLFLLMAGIN